MNKVFFFILLVCLFVGNSFAQTRPKVETKTKPQTKKQETTKTQENQVLVTEGRGMNGLVVGKSTMNDVIQKYGKNYKWVANKKYSYQMIYPKENLSFYICQSDKKKEIFLIEMKRPFKAKTTKGIILGKSTLEDVHRIYGKKKSGLEYRGVSFYYNEISGKNIVTEIDVTENAGLRQCKVGK